MASLHPENLAERLERAARQQGDNFGQNGWHRPVVLAPPPERRREPSLAGTLAFLLIVVLVLTVVLLVIAGTRGG